MKLSSTHASSTVLLSLGSNIGNREEFLRRTIEILLARKAIFDPILSSVYETQPVGYRDQPDFLNMSVLAGTLLLPEKLLAVCKQVERELGRKERPRWQEREIDIDILLYDNKIITRPAFSIPHAHMHERRFVLVPAAEIAPNAFHPLLRKSIKQLLEECPDKSRLKKIGSLPIELTDQP